MTENMSQWLRSAWRTEQFDMFAPSELRLMQIDPVELVSAQITQLEIRRRTAAQTF
jgi:hypothetical protein